MTEDDIYQRRETNIDMMPNVFLVLINSAHVCIWDLHFGKPLVFTFLHPHWLLAPLKGPVHLTQSVHGLMSRLIVARKLTPTLSFWTTASVWFHTQSFMSAKVRHNMRRIKPGFCYLLPPSWLLKSREGQLSEIQISTEICTQLTHTVLALHRLVCDLVEVSAGTPSKPVPFQLFVFFCNLGDVSTAVHDIWLFLSSTRAVGS